MDIVYRRWNDLVRFGEGVGSGLDLTPAGLAFSSPIGVVAIADPGRDPAEYEVATWTGPLVGSSFPVHEVIGSWLADTPGTSFIKIEISGQTTAGNSTKWFTLGHWAAGDDAFTRTSVPRQADNDGDICTDTYVARPSRELAAWRLRATLLRRAGSTDVPVLRALSAAATGSSGSAVPTPTSARTALGRVLDVPRYSQRLHVGEYPQWDGGGASWCSPTSTSMVLAYWGTGPAEADYAWVDQSYPDRWVAHAARHTYDDAYHGCGNWPFNTAYAGRFGMDAFVTRLRSLHEAELFIEAGIPLVVSASYRKGDVPGLPYDTNGHLMVLVGFTEDGDPVLNDPNSAANDEVRKTVGRAAWETAWLTSSRGVAYVIRPATVALPPAPAQPNW